MKWYGWIGLGLLIVHLCLVTFIGTAWELFGARYAKGRELAKVPNWPLYLLCWMLWWSAWQ